MLRGFRNFDLEDVHVEGTERIAEAVAKYDIDRFIHMSSHNADKTSTSEFYRTKVDILVINQFSRCQLKRPI